MSVSLARLRALQQQAGTAPAAPRTPAAPEVPRTPSSPPPAADVVNSVSAAAAGTSLSRTDARREPAPRAPAAHDGERSVLDWVDAEAHTRPARATSLPRADADAPPPAVTDTAVTPHTVTPDIARPAATLRRGGQDIAALRRLIGLRERQPSPSARTGMPAATRPAVVDRDLPGTEIAPGLHLIEAFLPQAIPSMPLSLAFAKRPDEAVQARDLLFFDTETTGLAGGTGTRAFMVGAADWHVDGDGRQGLRIRQLLMATMAAETAMLRAFADWLTPRTVLSSYNGRCYDAPLLKTRFRLARLPEPLGGLDHVDLLFPTRRRYRGSWENCRLATVERRLLGIVREDDLPGSEAPAAWLGYLRGGSARNLRRVGEHNHQDVVTLATLFQRLVAVEDEERAVLALQAQADASAQPCSAWTHAGTAARHPQRSVADGARRGR